MRIAPSFRFFTTAFALAVLLCCPTALPCRIILPIPPDMPRPQMPSPMQVKSHTVDLQIRDQVARVTVRAVFYNPNGRRIEGTYWFPIARDAAVNSFTMTVNGKTMEAEVLPADKARSIYEEIVRNQRDPAILEYIDEGMLRARVFPIEPYADVAIELSYDQALKVDGDLVRMRYPMLSARPDGNTGIGSLKINANIQSKIPLKSVFVPGFNATVNRSDETHATVQFEASNYVPQQDFEIVYSRSSGQFGVQFQGYRKGDDSYFLMLISPRSELQAEAIAAKDIIFVVDTSGSMQGEKIRQVREALTFCICSLSDKDHFSIVSFSTDVVPLSDATMPATKDNRERAEDFAKSLQARGGTAIDEALKAALAMPRAPDKVPLLVFLTDGLPTVGEVDPKKILGNVDGTLRAAGKDRQLPRIFSFGVGYDVNTRLLNGIAATSGGFPTYVTPQENLEIALSSFYDRVASPVMTDLKLETGDVTLRDLNPTRPPDLFRGGQVMITGRYKGTGSHDMVLSGLVGPTRERFAFTVNLDHDALNSYVPRLWATQRVAYLEEQILINGENHELVEEIKRLGREFGIVTRYTSMLIVEDGLVGRNDRLRPMPLGEPGAAADTGASAVMQAKESQEARSNMAPGAPADSFAGRDLAKKLRRSGNTVADDDASDAEVLANFVRTVHDKTFYMRASDGFLYDSDIASGTTPKPDITVVAWSADFLALLKRYPELKHYMQAGDKLVLQLRGKTIRITAE